MIRVCVTAETLLTLLSYSCFNTNDSVMSREDESEGREFSHESHGHVTHSTQTIKYFGSTQIDQRCSPSVTSWVMAEVKVRSSNVRTTTISCEGGVVTARDMQSNAVMFQHKAHYIIRFSRSTFQESTFAYLMRNKKNSRFYCYVFEGGNESEVSERQHVLSCQCPVFY